MIVLKVIALSMFTVLLCFFAVMSCIINYEESKCRKYFHSTFHKEEPHNGRNKRQYEAGKIL